MDVKLVSSSQGTEAGVNYTMGREEDLIRTDELIIKNLKTNKVLQISQEIGKVPVLSFGNSGGDCSMHNYALSNKKYKTAAFMLIADDDARDHANREKALKLGQQWREAGYHVISMRDDFKTIYGDGVEKTDFTFPVDTRALTDAPSVRQLSMLSAVSTSALQQSLSLMACGSACRARPTRRIHTLAAMTCAISVPCTGTTTTRCT